MSKLKLYYNLVSPPCRSVLMLLKILKINVQMEHVDIFSKKYIQKLSDINPQHTVPILQDNNFTIWESHAIGPYLISKYGNDDALYPTNINLRTLINQRLHFDSGVLYPTLHRAMWPVLFRNKFGISYSDVNEINKCYTLLNTFLKGSPWLCGSHLTLADISCLATVTTLDLIYPVLRKRYPNLVTYINRAEDLDFYREYNISGLDKLATEIQNKMAAYKKTYNEIKLNV